MTSLDADSLKNWETLADWGTIFVIVGVAGEGIEILIKFFEPRLKQKQKWRHLFHKADPWINLVGGIFWMMVVLGLWAEFKGSRKSKIILDAENARVNQQAGTAFKLA